MKPGLFMAGLCVSLLCGWTPASKATLIDETAAALQAYPNVAQAILTYDAAAEQLIATTSPASAYWALGGYAFDVLSSFVLTLSVDHSGVAHGGTFLWTGQSVTLGIASPTVLLSGAITSLELFPAGSAPLPTVQVLSDLSGVHAALQSIVGPVDSAAIWFRGLSLQASDFALPFTHTTAVAAPEIFGLRARTVSEPATLVLLLLAFAAGAWARHSRAGC